MEVESYPAILTEQAWLLRIYHNLTKGNIFGEKKPRRSPELATKAHLVGEWLGELFGPLEEPARDKREVRISVTACLTPNINFHFTNMFHHCLSFTALLYLP